MLGNGHFEMAYIEHYTVAVILLYIGSRSMHNIWHFLEIGIAKFITFHW